MESVLFFSCSLLLGTFLGQNHNNDRILNKVLGTVSDVATHPADIIHEKVKLATKLTESGVIHGTNLGKMGVAASAVLSSQGLGQAIDIGKQAIDLVGTVGEIVPGVELLPVKHVTDGGKAILTLGNNIGQTGIKATSYLGNQVLDKTKTITQITTGTLENLSSAGTGLIKNTVSTSLNAVANVMNTVIDAAAAFVPGIFPALEPLPEPEPNGIIQNILSYFTG
uniref:Hemolysin-like secreted salivary protein n=1 Tax=Dipetalogaster maximus TaxID=72496 RepID=G3CJS7_DIPMA